MSDGGDEGSNGGDGIYERLTRIFSEWGGERLRGFVDPIEAALEDFSVGSEEGAARMRRWRPVFGAARDVAARIWVLSRSVLEGGAELETGRVLEELSSGVMDVLESFPTIAELYRDADAFDRWKASAMEAPGVDEALFEYLARLRTLVDALVARLVGGVFSPDRERISGERVEQFLRQLDSVLRAVLDRWVVDAIVDPTTELDSDADEA